MADPVLAPDSALWHPIILPSKGVCYDDKCPEGKIHIKLWTTAQEEVLVRYGGTENLIDKMLEGNIKLPPGLAYEDLLLTDQFYVLVQLRSQSLCPFYTFNFQCSSCGTTTTPQSDLRELRPKERDFEVQEPFECFLPHAGVEVSLRMMRVKDTHALASIASKRATSEGMIVYRLARQIVKVDDTSKKFDEMKDFVAGLTMLDIAAIRNTLSNNGFDNSVSTKATCQNCGSEHEDVTIPLEENFFRPRRVDIERTLQLAAKDRGRD